MGLISKIKAKFEAKHKDYDVNAPISEYSYEQILKRIEDELGRDARCDFDDYYGCNNDHFLYRYKKKYNYYCQGPFKYSYQYFLNDFFQQAIVKIAKEKLYSDIKRDMADGKLVTEEDAKKKLETISLALNNSIAEAKEENKKEKEEEENKKAIARANKAEMPKIDELFNKD